MWQPGVEGPRVPREGLLGFTQTHRALPGAEPPARRVSGSGLRAVRPCASLWLWELRVFAHEPAEAFRCRTYSAGSLWPQFRARAPQTHACEPPSDVPVLWCRWVTPSAQL